MHVDRHDIAVLTGTGSTATAYSVAAVSGRILGINIVLPTSGQVVSTGVITVKTNTTNQTVWTKTATGTRTVYPRAPTHTAAGAVFATAAGNPVPQHFIAANELLKVTVAGGGVAKAATIRVFTD